MMRFRAFQPIAVAVALLAAAGSQSWAADGQIDVKLNGASTNSIATAGSYILVDSVVGTVTPILTISAPDVTLDLNGQTIEGGAGVTGINLTAAALRVRIKNGKIKNCVTAINGSTAGVVQTLIEDVQITCLANGTGITLLTEATVRNCTVTGGATGISVTNNSTVTGCNASNNTTATSSGIGIKLGNSCLAVGNVANGNTGAGAAGNGTGIDAGSDCTLMNNVCNGNLESATATNGIATGINAVNGCSLISNTCSNNARVGASGNARGIAVGDNCLVRGNTCNGNIAQGAGAQSGYGILAANGCRVEDNTCLGNLISGGATFGFGILASGSDNWVFRNFTRANTTAGIRLDAPAGGNRCEENRSADAAVVDGSGGSNSIVNNTTY